MSESRKYYEVAGKGQDDFSNTKIPTQIKDTQKEAEPSVYQIEAQTMLDGHRRFFTTFAKDVSLSFKFSDAFFIDLEKGEVNLAAQWFADKGFSKRQILWASLHELGHFRDLAEDPKSVMENFEYIGKQARTTGATMMKRWEDALGASDPDYIEKLKKQQPISRKNPNKTMNAVEQAAYKIHHTFYNIFDDIYDNAFVARNAPTFEPGEPGGKEVKRLYQEKLFAGTDYSKKPRHLQFVYNLLREEMVPDEAVVVGDEVQAALNQPIVFQGKTYTAKEIVKTFIKPRARQNTKAGQRYFVLQKTLEPIFQKLLQKDIEEWDPKKPETKSGQNKQSGEQEDPNKAEPEGNPFESDYNNFEQNNPDQIDEEAIKDWIDKHQKDTDQKKAAQAKAAADDKKTPEQKAQESQNVLDQNWRAEHSISTQNLKEFKKIEGEVAPHLEDLSKLWQNIVYGSSRQLDRDVEGYYKTGTELDIPELIGRYPGVVSDNPLLAAKTAEESRVMKRVVAKERLVERPDYIRVRLVGDMSGSMDENKRHILQQCFVLILSSLREFNTYLNMTRHQTKSKLAVDTEVWVFGSQAEKIKPFRDKESFDDEQAGIVKQFAKLNQTIGSTCDHLAFEAINNSLSFEDQNKIDQGKTMELIFEVTDGGSSDQAGTRQAVDSLLSKSIIVRAFQIGETDEEEKRIFNAVWNNGRESPHGEIVDKDIVKLLPALTALLKEYLSRVQL